MKALQFNGMGALFRMDAALEDDPIQSKGDAYLTIQVSSAGFTGRNDLWVCDNVFSEFCRSLVTLERSLKGECLIESVLPEELRLRVFAANSRGTLAIEGTTGYLRLDGDLKFWHSVSFGFAFEPQQLTKAISLPWMRR